MTATKVVVPIKSIERWEGLTFTHFREKWTGGFFSEKNLQNFIHFSPKTEVLYVVKPRPLRPQTIILATRTKY